MKLINVQSTKYNFTSITQYGIHFQQVFPCASINYRVGTTRVIAHHTTNHSPVGGRCFGAKEQAVWFQEHIQLVADYAGLNTYPMFLFIQFNDFGEVFGNVHNNSISNNLSRQRSSGGAGNDRRFVFGSKLN